MDKAATTSLGPGTRGLLAIILLGAGASLYFAVSAAFSDAASLQARWQISQWQADERLKPKPAELGRVRNDLLAALRWTPGDPQIHESLGYLSGVRAAGARAIPELEQAMLEESIADYRTAITLRPMSAYAWANLALAMHLKGGEQEALWAAYDHAYLYGNRETGVQRILAEVGFSHWDEAGAERQGQLVHMIDIAYPHARGDLTRIAGKYHKESLLAKP